MSDEFFNEKELADAWREWNQQLMEIAQTHEYTLEDEIKWYSLFMDNYTPLRAFEQEVMGL